MTGPSSNAYCSECGEPKNPEYGVDGLCDNCLPPCADCGDPAWGLEEKYCVDCWREVQALEDDDYYEIERR